jgi:hypothetical protein
LALEPGLSTSTCPRPLEMIPPSRSERGCERDGHVKRGLSPAVAWASPRIAAIVPRADAISARLVCLKSAEPFYEPSVAEACSATGAVSPVPTAGAGRALRYAGTRRKQRACLRPMSDYLGAQKAISFSTTARATDRLAIPAAAAARAVPQIFVLLIGSSRSGDSGRLAFQLIRCSPYINHLACWTIVLSTESVYSYLSYPSFSRSASDARSPAGK